MAHSTSKTSAGQEDEALPPVLMTPLYWLEADRPEVFVRYARGLLEEYGV